MSKTRRMRPKLWEKNLQSTANKDCWFKRLCWCHRGGGQARKEVGARAPYFLETFDHFDTTAERNTVQHLGKAVKSKSA